VSGPWPHDPRDVAHGVLADPRFALASQKIVRPWWAALLDALNAWWHRLWDPLSHAIGNPTLVRVIGYAVLGAVLVGLAFVVVRFARRVRIVRTSRPSAGAISLDAGDDARTLLARALAAAAEGRHREAAALLWVSALRALDERGRVRFDAARTPGEWRRAVRDPAFDALARDAVIALFGDRAVDASLVGRMRDAYDRIVAPA